MDSPVRLSLNISHCEPNYIKEITKALLHTILFHRLFSQVVPKTYEILDLTISYAEDEASESLVDERASAYTKSLRSKYDGSNSGGLATMYLEFFEKRTRKAWFSRGEEEVCWESWAIDVHVIPSSRSDAERKQNLAVLEAQLEAAVLKILNLVNQRNEEYIPPIPYAEGNPFPYQIQIR